jgi:hydrogenase nickel incorporation protein HypA/HybF
MHELAITQSVVDMIRERIAAPVTGVRLAIGPLSGIVPDAVRFCFDLVCAGTPLDGAWLDIVEPTAQAHCRACGTEFEPDGLIPLCPCGSPDAEILAGQDLRIVAVEVADSPAAADAPVPVT